MVNQEPITAILQGSSAKHVLKDLIIRGLNTKRQSDINMLFFFISDETRRSTKLGLEMKRQNRRALSVINQNLVVAKAYPCVVNKRRGLSE